MAYRVEFTESGLYRATLIGHETFFECEYWHVFEKELKSRLLDEAQKKLRTPVARKVSDQIATGFLGPDNKGNKNENT